MMGYNSPKDFAKEKPKEILMDFGRVIVMANNWRLGKLTETLMEKLMGIEMAKPMENKTHSEIEMD